MTSLVSSSEAAELNRKVMNKLRKAFDEDPEVDLTSKIPRTYSTRLASRKSVGHEDLHPEHAKVKEEPLEFPEDDLRNRLKDVTSATVVFPLSESVRSLLNSETSDPSLVDGLHALIKRSQVIWKPEFGCHKIVLNCSSGVVLKIIEDMEDTTEYTTLQFLETHLPGVPAPRPFGLVAFGERDSLLFMSLMTGTTLGAIWPTLDLSLKRSVQQQLNNIFTTIRSFRPPGSIAAFGGVAGEGCKDLRRHVRVTKEPIRTVEQFDDWQFSNPHFGSSIYIEFLRRLSPPLPSEMVLSHNDLRPDNIIVEYTDGQCAIKGIIDWQYSGFYPAYYECTKVMNPMTPNERDDWFSFIPECISAARYPQKFLLDALWWKCVE